jgi:glycosyltransferase involved in cell wall biosynthesis
MKANHRILMVLDHAFPPDLRVENEARTLTAAGFSVAILAIGEDSRPAVDDLDGIRIYRHRISNQLRNKMRGLAGTVPVIDWVLGRQIRRIYDEWPFAAIHAHDLYLFGACLKAGRRLQVPVVGDMHENWVHALSGYHWSTHYPGKAFISLKRWDRLETEWSRDVDILILVIEEMEGRMLEKGIDPEKMVVVPNTILRSQFDQMGLDPVTYRERAAGLRLVYTGGMDRHRGLNTLIDAMPEILATVEDASLLLVGDGAVRAELEERASQLGLSGSIQFEGWQPQDQIPSYIASADIGLIPHLKSVHTDNTIPHKLFHYMYMGLPVVASDCAPLKRIIQDTEAGITYPSGDSSALARAVIRLAGDEEERRAMGERGRRAVADQYNWENTSRGLVEAYKKLLGKHAQDGE